MGATGGLYAMMALSSASSVGGAYAQNRAIKASGDYQATVARTNTALADLEGDEALRIGSSMASRRNVKSQQEVGSARVAFAGQGVDLSSRTVRDVTASVREVGAMDELTIRNNAARARWGYKVKAIQSTYAGQFADLSAKTLAKQTILTGGIKAVSEPASMYANYMQWNRYLKMGATPAPIDSEWTRMV